MSFDLSAYQVGDEFETSPHELGRVISAILAEEGSFLYEGNSVTITALPKRKPVVEASEPVKEEVKVEEVVVKASEPVKEEVAVKAPEPVKEEVVVKAPEPIKEEVVVKAPEPIKEEPKPIVKEIVRDEPKIGAKTSFTPKPIGRPRKVEEVTTKAVTKDSVTDELKNLGTETE